MDGSGPVDAQQARQEAKRLRAEIRAGRWQTTTDGQARGMVQGNLAILPEDWSDDFEEFCRLNSKPCPLIAKTKPGDPSVPALGDDIDLRTDFAKYRIFRDGKCVDEVIDIRDLWQDDMVGFVLGCSYSFEQALMDEGLPMRHIENGTKVPIYMTNIETVPAGPFHGPMIVSMRPFSPEDAIRATEITARFPNVHGAPVHVGDPAQIGIDNIMTPYSGSTPDIRDGEVPVFWACGVTPQSVVEQARPPLCITHMAGHMLITDRMNVEFETAASG
jgi:uncharacterized protein YcsI (UPF0317 family)